jgi:hypothetical protein
MLRLALRVVVESVIGIAAAALVLAVAVPALIRRDWITPGDLTGSLLIGVVLAVAVVAMLVRPGSAINRHAKRHE